MGQLYLAQKGFIFSKDRKNLLVIKYSRSKYKSEIAGKLAMPGGKINFGERPDSSFIREVKEETGITIKPGRPFRLYGWTYLKDNDPIQIVAIARIGYEVSGQTTGIKIEKGTTISGSEWLKINNINITKFSKEEGPVVKYFLANLSDLQNF